MELSFNELAKVTKGKEIYMMIGNGSKNQFRDRRVIKGILRRHIVKSCSDNSVFLYFGDTANEKKPDVGLLFKYVKEMKPTINIYMIQMQGAKSWGVPDFVSGVYWHNDYTEKCKYGCVINGKPYSNTKKWITLHKRNGIKKVFIFGGGPITLDEYSMIKKYDIPYEYFPVERKFKGDGKTRIDPNDSLKERIGITWGKIK
jgi:hypothetical protein